jgi:predicted transposase YbfD/YdcC
MNPESIIEHFYGITDPRNFNKRHKLIDIIFITICAVICKAEKWDDIELFGISKEKWLKTYLELPHGIPSHDTIARVFAIMDPEEFNKCFLNWINSFKPVGKNEILNIDGKTLRHSYDKGNGKSAIHMVSAWANNAGVVLGQVKVDEKSNEITAIPELLNLLDIENCIVTIDAMGTQKKIAAQIIDKNADYLLALKGNQGTLKENVELFFQDAEENNYEIGYTFDYHKSVNKDHGRIEKRECWVTSDIDWLEEKMNWEGLQSICMVKSERIINNEKSVENRYYISSLAANAEKIGNTVREHWGIENSLHWVLDVAFREDECRKRNGNAAENFAIVRHIALNLLKQEKTLKRSINGKRLMAGWDSEYLEKILFQL